MELLYDLQFEHAISQFHVHFLDLWTDMKYRGRITEVMNTLVTMGATLIRGHTLGVSVGNPLSMMPSLGTFNEAAFETMDWAVFEAGQKGLRIMAPLIDNYVRQILLLLQTTRAYHTPWIKKTANTFF